VWVKFWDREGCVARMAITIVLGVEFMALAVGTRCIWCAFQILSYELCVLEKSIPKHYSLVLFLFVLLLLQYYYS
jgi:hypothetical protein